MRVQKNVNLSYEAYIIANEMNNFSKFVNSILLEVGSKKEESKKVIKLINLQETLERKEKKLKKKINELEKEIEKKQKEKKKTNEIILMEC